MPVNNALDKCQYERLVQKHPSQQNIVTELFINVLKALRGHETMKYNQCDLL